MNVQSTVGPGGVPVFSSLLNECALRKFRIAGHTILVQFLQPRHGEFDKITGIDVG